MLSPKAICCIYTLFAVNNLPRFSNFKALLKRNFCSDHPLSFLHRFLNAKFFNRFNFTSLRRHIFKHYAVFPCYTSTMKI